MSVVNFGSETINALDQHGYTINDIAWIGTREFTIPTFDFFKAARRTNYNCGYGSAEMPCDLIIMMKDGAWYSRGEYDGSEWWELNVVPQKPILHRFLKVRAFNEMDLEYWEPTLAQACRDQEVL